MDIDLALKSALIITICLCIVIFTVSVARLLNSIKQMVEETTKIVTDASEVSGTIASGIQSIKEGNFINALGSFAFKLGAIKPVVDFLRNRLKSKKSKDKDMS